MNTSALHAPEHAHWWSDKEIDKKFGASEGNRDDFLRNKATLIHVPTGLEKEYLNLATNTIRDCEDAEAAYRAKYEKISNDRIEKADKKNKSVRGSRKRKLNKPKGQGVDKDWHHTNPTRIILLTEQENCDSSDNHQTNERIAIYTIATATHAQKSQGKGSRTKTITLIESRRAPKADMDGLITTLKDMIPDWEFHDSNQYPSSTSSDDWTYSHKSEPYHTHPTLQWFRTTTTDKRKKKRRRTNAPNKDRNISAIEDIQKHNKLGGILGLMPKNLKRKLDQLGYDYTVNTSGNLTKVRLILRDTSRKIYNRWVRWKKRKKYGDPGK